MVSFIIVEDKNTLLTRKELLFMSRKIEFSTAAFGGFDKKQVLDYIYKVHSEADSQEALYKEQIEELTKEIEEKQQQLDIAIEKVENIQTENNLSQSANDLTKNTDKDLQELHNIISSLNEKVEYYERIINDMPADSSSKTPETTNADIQKEWDELERQKNALTVERQNLEESSSQIGKVMLDAHNKADDIIIDAENTAKEMLRRAKATIEDQRVKANQIVLEHQESVEKATERQIEEANNKARETIDKAESYTQKIMKDLSDTATEATDFLVSLRNKVEALNNTTEKTLHSMQERASRELKEKYSDIIEERDDTEELLTINIPSNRDDS